MPVLWKKIGKCFIRETAVIVIVNGTWSRALVGFQGAKPEIPFHGLIFYLKKLYSWPKEAIPVHNQPIFLG